MKKIVIYILLFAIFFLRMPVFATEFSDPTTESTGIPEHTYTTTKISSIQGIDANNALLGMDKLINNARSAIVYEANSQTLMYAWNPDAQMYPASLVKIMTVLVAIENAELTEIVTVSQEAISSVPHDAVSAKLLAGEKLSVKDLLYCILLGSANDACAALAEHIGGSESGFVDMMNQRADVLGCSGTYFTNPHGLHDDNQHTTARDCARILSAAMESDVFREVFTADDYTVEKTNLSELRRFTSGNYMKDTNSKLYYDSRVIGGRTGVTQDGRRCLESVAERNGMCLITVVMGAESVYQEDGYSAISIGGYRETTKLLDVCLDGYKTVQLLFENQAIRQIPVAGGDCDLVIGPQVSVATVLPVNITSEDLVFRYSDQAFTLPIEEGQHISNLQIWHGSMCVAQAELYAMNGVKTAQQDVQQNVEENTGGSLGAVWVLICIAVIIFGVFLVIRYSGKIRRILKRKKNRRHSRDRRRNR